MAKVPGVDEFPHDSHLANEWLNEWVKTSSRPNDPSLGHLPAVRWSDGTPITMSPLLALMQTKKEPMRVLFNHIKPRLNESDMALLARKLAEIWDANDAPRAHRWMLESLGEWGDDAGMLALGALIRHWQRTRKHTRATSGIHLLRDNGSDAALIELDDLANSAKSIAARRRAAEALREIALARGLTPDELADRVVPMLGFDSSGARQLDYGSRSFNVRLRSDLSLEIVDGKGKVVRSVPRPTQSDDATLAGSASDWLKVVKKRLKELASRQCARLERAMIAGRTWPAPLWRQFFLDHPLMRLLSRRVVWTALGGQPVRETTFRVAEDWTLADEREDVFFLSGEASVRLAHPLFWSDETRTRWRQIFSDYEVVSAFAQVDRETYRVPLEESRETSLTRYCGLTLDRRFLRGQFARLGWTMGPPMEAGVVNFHARVFDAQGISAFALHEGFFLGADYREAEPIAIDQVFFLRTTDLSLISSVHAPKSVIPLGQIDSLVASETIRDLERLSQGAQQSSE